MVTQTSVNVGGSWENVALIYTKVSGTWRRCPIVYTKVSGTWNQVHNDFSAASSDATANAGIGQTQTESITINPSNGVSPYTYSWAYVSGSVVPTISNATSQTVHWNSDGASPYNATWRCTVTDALGSSVTVDESVQFLGP